MENLIELNETQEESLDCFLATIEKQLARRDKAKAKLYSRKGISLEAEKAASLERYKALLGIASQVQNDIADKLNEKREAAWKAFFRFEDLYFPATKDNDYVALWENAANQATTMPLAA